MPLSCEIYRSKIFDTISSRDRGLYGHVLAQITCLSADHLNEHFSLSRSENRNEVSPILRWQSFFELSAL